MKISQSQNSLNITSLNELFKIIINDIDTILVYKIFLYRLNSFFISSFQMSTTPVTVIIKIDILWKTCSLNNMQFK